MINRTAELMISCQRENMMCTESKQTHRVQQQDHSRIRLTEAVQEDSEDEAVEEALHVEKALAEEEVLAKVVGQSLVIIVEL